MIQQDPGPGMLYVFGGCEQYHWPGVGQFDEMLDRVGPEWPFQLGPVTTGELLEAIHVVPVPATELGAGSRILEPLVESCFRFLDPTGPQTIDQDPVPLRTRAFVDAMDLERHVSLAYARNIH
jgi:hypothetical protein